MTRGKNEAEKTTDPRASRDFLPARQLLTIALMSRQLPVMRFVVTIRSSSRILGSNWSQ